MNNGMENQNNSGAKIFGAIVAGILILIVGLGGCEKEPTQEDLDNAGKWRECSERSNTYYKCDWNFSEDRCTCKER